jgi:hypothetical protein
MIFSFIYFILITFVVFYLPGRFLLRRFQYTSDKFIITISLSFGIGIANFIFGTYFLSWIHLAIFYNLFLVISVIFEIKPAFNELKKQNFKNLISLEMLIILFGTLVMSSLVARSGKMSGDNMIFYGVNYRDGLYHISLIGSMLHSFPPLLPSVAGLPLRGYHFFYDFLLANLIQLYHFNIMDLFFRLFPLFLTFLYGITSLALARFLKMDKIASNVFLFTMYFATNMSYLLPFFFNKQITGYNTGINSQLSNIVNPSVLLAIIFIFLLIILLFTKNVKKQIILPALILGILPQIKFYAAVPSYISLLIIFIVLYVKKKDLLYGKILLLSAILSAFVFLPFNWGAGKLLFSPLTLYYHFIESFAQSNNFPWILQFLEYREHHNYIRMSIFYLLTLSLFFLPTLGMRCLSFIFLGKLFSKKFYALQNLFIFIFILTSLYFSSCIIGDTDIFNSVQYLWFAYILLLIPTAYCFSNLINKFHRGKIFAIVILFLILIIFSLPDNVSALKGYSTNPFIVTSSLLKISSVVSQIPQQKGIMVLNQIQKDGRNSEMYEIPLMSALSGHAVYYESTANNFTNSKDIIPKRINMIGEVETLLTKCDNPREVNKTLTNILTKTNNDYILTLSSYGCLHNLENFKQIFVIDQYSIFELLHKQ